MLRTHTSPDTHFSRAGSSVGLPSRLSQQGLKVGRTEGWEQGPDFAIRDSDVILKSEGGSVSLTSINGTCIRQVLFKCRALLYETKIPIQQTRHETSSWCGIQAFTYEQQHSVMSTLIGEVPSETAFQFGGLGKPSQGKCLSV